MIIQSLKLKNFRNYELLNLTFHPVTNIFHGDNAQGKTNILEAVYLAGTTKSHRGTERPGYDFFWRRGVAYRGESPEKRSSLPD